MNTPKPPAPGTEAHRIALMAQLAQWLLNALGPVNALEVAGQVLGTLGSLATPPGAPLPPELNQIRDAADAAMSVLTERLSARVAVVAPGAIDPKKLRSV